MGNNLLEVNYLRAIAIVSLVAWHCFFCPIYVWPMAPQNVNLYHLPFFASLLLPDCDMPLFTFISGYLFEYLYEEKHRYRNFGLFLQNKLNRLLIPFFILSVLVIATSYQEAFSDILWGEGSHLWYCAMLFWCFMMAWIIKKLDARWIFFLLLLVSLTLVFLYPNFWYIPFRLPLGIDNSLYYFSYFLMGGVVLRYRYVLLHTCGKFLYLFVLGYLLIFAVGFRNIHIVSHVANYVKAFYWIFLLWLFCCVMLDKGYFNESEKIDKLCEYSFGIYVFHHWITWNLCWWKPFHSLMVKHYLLIPILLYPIVFLLSYVLTKYSVRTSVGKYLLK